MFITEPITYKPALIHSYCRGMPYLFSISNHLFSQSYINGTRGTEQDIYTHTHAQSV